MTSAARLPSEIERLRAVLREIDAIRTASDWNGKRLDHAAEIARRALAQAVTYDPRMLQMTRMGIGMMGPQASPFDRANQPLRWWEQRAAAAAAARR